MHICKNVDPKNKKNVNKRIFYEKNKSVEKRLIKNVFDKLTKLFIPNAKIPQ